MVAYSFKKRFVEPIRVGLSRITLSFDCTPKRQTIRAIGKRRHARPGETLQLYTAMRTKQCEKIGDARCTEVGEIVIAFGKRPNNTIISIDGAARYTGPALHAFAQNDGFVDWDDMVRFWEAEHGTSAAFKGVLIQWEPL